MFGFVSKRKLLKEAVSICRNNEDYFVPGDSEKKNSERFWFYCGNHNGLSCLCSRLGMNLTNGLKKEDAE